MIGDPAPWADGIAREAASLGLLPPEQLGSATAAVQLLASGDPVAHLLLDPDRAGPLLEALLDMTEGEADSPTRVFLLGGGPDRCGASVVSESAPGWLGRAIGRPAPPRDATPLSSQELRGLLDGGRLRARYQPIVSLRDRRPIGLEALSRLDHPTRLTLSPALFVPQSEATGLAWTLFQHLTQRVLADWTTHNLAALRLPININVPVAELLRADLAAWLLDRCAESGVPPAALVLEMTETQAVDDRALLRVVTRRLRALGFGVVIDDVGPGLRDPDGLFDMDFVGIKFDRQLVADMQTDPEARRNLRALLGRARAAGLATIAEGIEDQIAWDRVQALGFEHAQGFFAARPLPPAVLAIWQAGWTAPRAAVTTSS